MAHVVTESCIKCKYTECVEVCPQKAFREGENFVVIDPDECANCALCAMMCPVDAIFADYNLPEGQENFAELNRKLAKEWPEAKLRAAPEDADAWATESNKAGLLSFSPFRGL